MSLPPRISQWWLHLKDAAKAHGVDVFLLAAIMDRESCGGRTLTPEGPTGTGDNGHGRGLMQIDDRSHEEFIEQVLPTGKPAWQDAWTNIAMGAQILAHALERFKNFPDCPDPEIAAVAAYNAGEGVVLSRMEDITRPVGVSDLVRELNPITSGGDYLSDVFIRRSRFMQTTHPGAEGK